MKRKLKNALRPQKSFEEWAGENSIFLKDSQLKTKRHEHSVWKWQRKVVAGLYSVLAVCLIAAVLLPVLLLNQEKDIPINPKYTAQDVVSERIEINELYGKGNLLLYDIEQIMDTGRVMTYFANDDYTLVLGYRIESCLIATSDEKNAFYVDYRIRTYENYEFAGYREYIDLPLDLWIGETKISYRLSEESRDERIAYISFSYGSIEYFLDVRGFPEVTEITDDTLKILLGDLLK